MESIAGLIISGGVLSHMAVIAREFNIPCLVAPDLATNFMQYNNASITINARTGIILAEKDNK